MGEDHALGGAKVINDRDAIAIAVKRSDRFGDVELDLAGLFELLAHTTRISQRLLQYAQQLVETRLDLVEN